MRNPQEVSLLASSVKGMRWPILRDGRRRRWGAGATISPPTIW